MKTFKQYTEEDKSKRYEWMTIEIDDYIVNIFFSLEETILLNEAKHKGIPLGGKYSAQLHSPHFPDGKKHLHVYAKQNQIFSLNIDGTAHDQSHKTRIPSKVSDAIKNYFPSFSLPKNNLIESAPRAIQLIYNIKLLCENI